MSHFTRTTETSELLVRDAAGEYRAATGDEVLKAARQVLGRRVRRGTTLTSPQVVRDYLQTKLGDLEHEVFVTLLLDSQHRLIEYAELFRGTLAQTSVYPREVVKIGLLRNAAAMIFAHNHPSGVPEPSRADELLTQTLKQALALVDVRVLDHFIVAGAQITSFAERGLI
ncbi:MAG: DNA repair protein RadC [Casimicrobiaceae bacterium]